MKLRKALVKFW